MSHISIRRYYDSRYLEEQLAAFPRDESRLEAWLDPLAARLQAGASVFDLGCGVGYACAFLAHKGLRVTGADVSTAALFEACGQAPTGNFTVIGADSELPFSDFSFDALVCLGVLEHVPEATKMLDECHRVLRRETPAVFVVPNALSPYFLFTRGTGQIYEHPRRLAAWRRLFSDRGFEIVAVSRDPGPSPRPTSPRRQRIKISLHRLFSLLPMNFTYQFVIHLQRS